MDEARQRRADVEAAHGRILSEQTFASHVPIGARRFRERAGLDFEQFEAGQLFKHRPGLTISQQDNVEEALDTQNRAMLHYDARYAARTEWGQPLVVSTLTIQRVIGMTGKTFGKRCRVLGFTRTARKSARSSATSSSTSATGARTKRPAIRRGRRLRSSGGFAAAIRLYPSGGGGRGGAALAPPDV